MKAAPQPSWMSFDNILYIGDVAKDCIRVIEKFNGRLHEIQANYADWFDNDDKLGAQGKLQRHIQYHFEGGVAMFKFKNEEELPDFIRRECFIACRNIVFEQQFFAS